MQVNPLKLCCATRRFRTSAVSLRVLTFRSRAREEHTNCILSQRREDNSRFLAALGMTTKKEDDGNNGERSQTNKFKGGHGRQRPKGGTGS